MHNLVEAAWPHSFLRLRYRPPPADPYHFKVLEIHISEDNSDPEIDILEKTFQELSHHSGNSRRCCLRLVVVTQSWSSADHRKIPYYNISKENFNKILDSQGLTSFFCQTRVDVAGVFARPTPCPHKADTLDSEYFGLIYDSWLGLWASYDRKCKQWQGICTINENGLNLKAIAQEFINFVQSETFLYLFAAKYTVDFLGSRLGEMNVKVAEIERHTGHHDSILLPAPATYKDLGKISATATATANLVSYDKTVVKHLADELLQYLQGSYDKDNSQTKDMEMHVASLRRRVNSVSACLSYLEQRVERQVTAIFHLINQADASTNFRVAHDMKILAIACRSDSMSMKILAAVTTTFLPGAFVATLFSMDMFDWFAGHGTPVVSGRFWIYWSVTIPLTLLTVGIWLGWEFWVMSRQKKQHQP
jgi:hypothetical protein